MFMPHMGMGEKFDFNDLDYEMAIGANRDESALNISETDDFVGFYAWHGLAFRQDGMRGQK